MNTLAEHYVRLVLALGQHDADYVDAYYGPPEWRKEAETAKLPLADIDRDARVAGDSAAGREARSDGRSELVRLRHRLPDAPARGAARARGDAVGARS